jgi:hypothetical protein
MYPSPLPFDFHHLVSLYDALPNLVGCARSDSTTVVSLYLLSSCYCIARVCACEFTCVESRMEAMFKNHLDIYLYINTLHGLRACRTGKCELVDAMNTL